MRFFVSATADNSVVFGDTRPTLAEAQELARDLTSDVAPSYQNIEVYDEECMKTFDYVLKPKVVVEVVQNKKRKKGRMPRGARLE